ncbi:amidase [Ahrensia sp. R2A130]|uniref:amidase n=1 Tax=Ahrensia sp. R2A130 TaxID=744979 RepID=UPI0001E0BC93|nr:amidase [Ahrensia sp. R2A130]EFL88756.1 glutamyl-tRNA(Gln) amidotransferase subunit A [Ahrensia sp. R2A130]
MKNPELNAWCNYEHAKVPHAETGPLAGLKLAVKDIYQVAGYPNGWGSPTRLVEAEVDTETQSVIQQMLDAGIEVAGKSQCEELCFSLTGINKHYGAPVNAAAPDRVTGGSSSGSASLVSAGVVEVATGSDTGGSVRGPASYCGLIGLRPTYGRLSLDRTMPLADSYDCFGWFTKDGETFGKVADVVLGEDADDTKLRRLIAVPELDAQLLGDDDYLAYAKGAEIIEKHFDDERHFEPLPFDLEEAYWAFRVCQAYEAWQSLGPWIEKNKPQLGPGVKERFEFGASITKADFEKQVPKRLECRLALEELIGSDGLLVMPTMPSCAPLKNESEETLQAFRERALRLLCLSGNSGLPQITLPLATVHGAPLGVSIIGPRGSDRRLVRIAEALV